MAKREEKRNLETIPVGSLGIIPLEGCKSLGEKVDYLHHSVGRLQVSG